MSFSTQSTLEGEEVGLMLPNPLALLFTFFFPKCRSLVNLGTWDKLEIQVSVCGEWERLSCSWSVAQRLDQPCLFKSELWLHGPWFNRELWLFRFRENGAVFGGGTSHERGEPEAAEEAAEGDGEKRGPLSTALWERVQLRDGWRKVRVCPANLVRMTAAKTSLQPRFTSCEMW